MSTSPINTWWLTCLTAMLTRTELIEPSIKTFSFSFLLMITGCKRSSLLLLQTHKDIFASEIGQYRDPYVLASGYILTYITSPHPTHYISKPTIVKCASCDENAWKITPRINSDAERWLTGCCR